MEKVNCPICESKNFTFVERGTDTLHNVEGIFEVVKCNDCQLMLTNPRPDILEIKKYYPEDYSPYEVDFKRAEKIARSRKRHPYIFSIIDPQMTLDLDSDRKKNNVLEIGCGSGNFLYELKSLHPEWIVQGTDFSEKSVAVLKKYGIDVFVSDLTVLPIESNSIDIIYGWMIVEHTHDINKALTELHRVLKNNGQFAFSIPNAGSWEFRFFGHHWFALQLPTHLYHFSEDTVTKILDKNGFRVTKIIHQKSVTNILLSLKIIIEKSVLPKFVKRLGALFLQWNIVYFFLTLPLAHFLAIIRQSGRLTIIARKKDE